MGADRVVEQKQKKLLRKLVLEAIYEGCSGSQRTSLALEDLKTALGTGLDDGQLADTVIHLEGEGFISVSRSIAGIRSVTLIHQGIKEIENPTPHLAEGQPGTTSFIVHGDAHGVNFMNASPGGRQETATTQQTPDGSEVLRVLQMIREAASTLQLSAVAQKEIDEHAAVIENELKSAEPDKPRIRSALALIRAVLLGIGEHAVAVKLLESIQHLSVV